MTAYDSTVLERAVTDGCIDCEKRDVRALTEYMMVLPQGGNVYDVATKSGKCYRVDTLEGCCSCPDKEYRLANGELCKHERRVRFSTGERAVPAWVAAGAIDPLLGEHTKGTPRVAATDGGIGIEAGDDGESLREEVGGRPDDCGCWDPEQGLPCWPCYRDGFETPNPNAEAEGTQ